MDDLISRKALLEAIDSSFIIPILKINMREEYKAVLRIREIIANMQTGFDKEKVIEEIRNVPYGYYNVEVENEIVEIVEKGGIE